MAINAKVQGEKICHVGKFAYLSSPELICHLLQHYKMCTIFDVLSHFLCCFVANSLFYAIYAVLSHNLFCRNLRTLAWRKNGPNILSVEKKGQISGMIRIFIRIIILIRIYSDIGSYRFLIQIFKRKI